MPRPRKSPPRPGPRGQGGVLVRLTPEERERIREAATRSGLGVGPWLRSLGLREAERSR